MPRLEPPPGYTTATDAARRLGISVPLLSRYVEQEKLHRYGPEKRVHKFYKLSEIETLLAAERVFPYAPGNWRDNPTTRFELATDEDMPTIVEISRHIFGDPPIPAAPRLAWLRKNPETFHVLRNQSGEIVGYASLLPLSKEMIDRFVRDEIEAEQITGDDVYSFIPGKPMHLYIMAIGVDPRFSTAEKHEYGAALMRGIYNFLFDLAERGIIIETITARSYKPDGLRLLRKMGFAQLRSPVPGKSLFFVQVKEAGFYLFDRYSELLKEWQRENQKSSPQHKNASRPAQTQGGALPDNLVGWRFFSRLHGIGESTTQAAIEAGRLQIVPGEWKVGRTTTKGALDQAGRAKFYTLYHDKPQFKPCDNCPHKA
jgi:hypothetical protein